MKSIIFVIGPACSGKTHYIKTHFPDYKVVNLFDYQQSRPFDIMQSYEDCLNGLKDAVRNNDKVILEHTLLKKIRRKPYIEAVSEYGPVDVIALNPSLELLMAHEYQRFGEMHKAMHEDSLSIYELPEDGDGFKNIIILGDDDLNA